MASKEVQLATTVATQEDTVRAALLQALRAPNSDYNVSLKEANKFREHLAGLGMRIDVIVANPMVTGGLLADFISEDDLINANIDRDLPLHLNARYQGRDDWHNIGLQRKMLRPGTPAAFRAFFSDVYGTADPAGRSAVDLLLGLENVQQALQKYLAQG